MKLNLLLLRTRDQSKKCLLPAPSTFHLRIIVMSTTLRNGLGQWPLKEIKAKVPAGLFSPQSC
jgi:hypothetical protein